MSLILEILSKSHWTSNEAKLDSLVRAYLME
jgi:hypothetical protein